MGEIVSEKENKRKTAISFKKSKKNINFKHKHYEFR